MFRLYMKQSGILESELLGWMVVFDIAVHEVEVDDEAWPLLVRAVLWLLVEIEEFLPY